MLTFRLQQNTLKDFGIWNTAQTHTHTYWPFKMICLCCSGDYIWISSCQHHVTYHSVVSSSNAWAEFDMPAKHTLNTCKHNSSFSPVFLWASLFTHAHVLNWHSNWKSFVCTVGSQIIFKPENKQFYDFAK